MKTTITKKSLRQSIDLISELKLDDSDLHNIFSNFRSLLDKPAINEKIKNISEITDDTLDMKEVMKLIIEKLSIEELNLMMGELIKDEGLVDYIQDLFLEKLL